MTADQGRLCRIYKGSRRRECYLYVDHEDDLMHVPEALVESLGSLSLVMELQLNNGRRLARVEAVRVLEQIRSQGYFLQLPPGEEQSGV